VPADHAVGEDRVMSSWGCPYNINGRCVRVKGIPCQMGMKGCVLAGRFVFADETRNRPRRRMEKPGAPGSGKKDAQVKD